MYIITIYTQGHEEENKPRKEGEEREERQTRGSREDRERQVKKKRQGGKEIGKRRGKKEK